MADADTPSDTATPPKPAVEAATPAADTKKADGKKADDIKRYDLLLVAENRSFGLVDVGTRSVMNFLLANGVMKPTDEAIAKEWVEIYGDAGPTAHEAFTRRGYTGVYDTIREIVVRTGKREIPLPWGPAKGQRIKFFIEFRGALWDQFDARFKNKLQRVLYTRPEVFVREHTELPPHVVVPDDEQPDEVKFKKRDNTTHRIGTAVEEF